MNQIALEESSSSVSEDISTAIIRSEGSTPVKKTPSDQRIVTFNVGGKIFQTRKCTLERQPKCYLNLLAEHNAEKETIFIDRDSRIFPLILNYLRDGTVIFPDDGITALLLCVEAKFFNLTELVTVIKAEKLSSREAVTLAIQKLKK